MSLRTFRWSWEQKTEEERRLTLQMRIQAMSREAVCYDYLLSAAEGTDLTDEEARSLKWLAGCELSTVMNVASVLRKAREQAPPDYVKSEPLRRGPAAVRRRSGLDR